jgi:hypothetical protein
MNCEKYLQQAPQSLGMQIQLALSPYEVPNHHILQQSVWPGSVMEPINIYNI